MIKEIIRILDIRLKDLEKEEVLVSNPPSKKKNTMPAQKNAHISFLTSSGGRKSIRIRRHQNR